MKGFLHTILQQHKEVNKRHSLRNTLLVLLLGVGLGIFSKWLDNTPINDANLWLHILGLLDLRNVFSETAVWVFLAVSIAVYSRTPVRSGLHVFLFFLGMTVSYHTYTVLFCGFNPSHYMLLWYGITALSPIVAFVCWYAKGRGMAANLVKVGIISFMFRQCFSVGIWYIGFHDVIDTLIFIATVIVLYVNSKIPLHDETVI